MAKSTRRLFLTIVVVGIASISPPSFGHGGGLNADGCHTNRRTGEYHCHRPAASRPPATAPAFSGQAFSGRREGGASEVRYANCAEVRAAGKAPLRRGEPGYAAHLDRDNDGIACEPPRR